MTMPTPTPNAGAPLSQERVREIEQMLAAVTPGPWTEIRQAVEIEGGRAVYESYVSAGAQNIAYRIGRAKSTRLPQDRFTPESSFDARFIAASPTIVAELLADRTALTARVAELEHIVEWLRTALEVEGHRSDCPVLAAASVDCAPFAGCTARITREVEGG